MKAISFVGSTPIARYVYETGTAQRQAGAGPRRREEPHGGAARTPTWTWPRTPRSTPASAPPASGAWRSARWSRWTSVADELIGKITERMATLRTGDGRRGCDMGPLVTGAHRDKVAGYVQAGVDAGAELVVDGREPGQSTATPDGFWLGPTLFDKVTPDMSIYTDEIFGPVLSVVRVDSYDEGLDLINTNPYGNGTAIFTNDGGAARRFQNEVEVGMVGINVPGPGPGRLLLLRRLEGLAVRRHPRPRHRGLPLLHPRQGHHHPLARPQPRRPEPRLPAERLAACRTDRPAHKALCAAQFSAVAVRDARRSATARSRRSQSVKT